MPAPDAPPLVQDARGPSPNPARLRLAVYLLCALSVALGWFDYYWPSVSHDAAPTLVTSAAMMAAPLATIWLVLRAPAAFEVGRWRRGPNAVILLPFVGLLVANLGRGELLAATLAIAAAGLGALAGLAIGWSVRGSAGLRSPRALTGMLALCGAAYGWGATTVIDVQFDGSAGHTSAVEVLDKHTSYGRQSTDYWLDLAPWGPHPARNSIEVDRTTFEAVPIGGQVCVTVHPGVLRMAWYAAAPCGAGLSSVPPAP